MVNWIRKSEYGLIVGIGVQEQGMVDWIDSCEEGEVDKIGTIE